MIVVERLILVHGSVVGSRSTWKEQAALAERFELYAVDRPGFPPNPPVERIDFESDAELVASLLRDGDHLVGHSYGGVIALLAAALRPATPASLTVIEPPATRVALDVPEVAAFAERAERLWATGPRDDPEAFLRLFLEEVGSDFNPPSPLPPALELRARMLAGERLPSEADVPLEALRRARFPKLVVSGAHHPAFEAICDRLERELAGERVVLPSHGHSVQRHPHFNERLVDFVERATKRAERASTSEER